MCTTVYIGYIVKQQTGNYGNITVGCSAITKLLTDIAIYISGSIRIYATESGRGNGLI